MKVGVISAKTLAEHNRFDSGFYFGRDKDAELRTAEIALRRAIGKYRRARQAKIDAETRASILFRDGEIKQL